MKSILVFSLLAVLAATAHAQENGTAKFHLRLDEVAGTYDIERAKIADSPCDCFWMKGGSAQASVQFLPDWSVVGSFGGAHASNIEPGVDLSRLTWLAGPRFTYNSTRFMGEFAARRESHLFGEVLAGSTHGFNSVFPTNNGVTSSASSYALQVGSGLEVALAGGLSLRPVEVDYLRTALPNSASNSQNDLRLTFGLGYWFGRR